MLFTGGMRRTRGPVGVLVAGVLVVAGCSAPVPWPPPTPSPAASPTPTPPEALLHASGPDTTGVPEGVELEPYTGDCTITVAGTVIDAKLVDCRLRIRAADVVITRSHIRGNVSVRDPAEDWSFTIRDSLVDAGQTLDTALGNGNFTAQRVEVVGGRRSMYCETDCLIEDSWVHGQAGDPEGQAHLSGIRMSQNTTIRRTTIVCDAPRIPPESGCSAGLTGYGGVAPVQNNLIEGNVFHGGSSTFCAYGGSSESKRFAEGTNRVRFVGNVFVRGETGTCGLRGAVASFDPDAPGNEWRDNVWDDGSPYTPS